MRRGARGFTLLEMMIAMAILAGGLTWLVEGMTSNIRAENHAKMITTATFLARGKMIDFEDELYDKGFGEFDQEQKGSFEDKGFERFAWRVIVDKVELPNAEQMQTVLTKAQQAKQEAQGEASDTNQPQTPLSMLGGSQNGQNGSSGGNPLSAGAGMLGSQFGLIKGVLEQGIRRVTVEVSWTEGKRPEKVSVVAYYTDVRTVDQAIQLSIPGNIPGAGGAAGASGGTGAGSTSTGTGATSTGSSH